MNRRIATILLWTILFGGALAEDVADTKKKAAELRKVSPKTILQGVANSCGQMGKVAGAKDKKEKQQETCNLIASFFQLAADVSKEKEEDKKNKNSRLDNDQKENAEDKKAITDQTVNLVLGLVDIINAEPENSELRAEPSVYLSMLKDLPTDEARSEIIEQILKNKDEAIQFLEEIINKLKNILFVSIPEMTSSLLDYLKPYFKK